MARRFLIFLAMVASVISMMLFCPANALPKAREKCEWSGEVRYERNANYASKDETFKLDESCVAIVEMEKNKENDFGFETRSASGSYSLKYSYFSGDSCDYLKADLTGGGIIQNNQREPHHMFQGKDGY